MIKLSSFKQKLTIIIALIIVGLTSRFLPHAFNFTPVLALVLFASAYFNIRYSLLTLLGIMLISDLFIGFYSMPIMLAVYGSFVLVALIGTHITPHRIQDVVFGAISSSALFYLITNWAVWQFGTMYEHSTTGLTQSYIAALPFFRNSLAGDLIYTGLLFGIMYAASNLPAIKARLRNLIGACGSYFPATSSER